MAFFRWLDVRRRVGAPGLAWLILLLLAIGCAGCDRAGAPDAAAREGASAVRSDTGFRSRRLLDEHFRKHASDIGASSREDYLRRAQELRDRPRGDRILEVARDDGVVTRFDRTTGAFIAFDRDGTIRTFFRPNDGEAYFWRQSRREHGR